MAHVANYKKETVKKIEKLILEYPIIGAVNMESLPTPPLQKMRAQLRGKVEMMMAKRRLIKIAIEKCKDKKPGIEKIEEHLRGMPALIFTKDNPFALFKTLKKSKSKAAAKAGQTAPSDIYVKAGATNFAPGPIIGELGAIGIKCGVENGKVAIKQDSLVVKEGDKVGPKQAEILARLGVEPMDVGLDLVATFENGTIFTKSVLDIDEDAFKKKLATAVQWAVNLSVETGYVTKDTIEIMIVKAFNDAKAIGLERNIIDDLIIDELLGRAERQCKGLKAAANIPDKVEEAPLQSEDTKNAKTLIQKEVQALEEEKNIIEEERELEKPSKVEQAPVEKEVREAVKEEEEKKLEVERIEQEKTEDKVAEMVNKMKRHGEKKPSAAELIEEVKKEDKKQNIAVPSIQELAQKKDVEHKSAEQLTKELLRKGTLRK